MSGAEIVLAIGLAASITQLVDYTRKAIARVQQLKQGSAYEDVLSQLDLFLQDVLNISHSIISKSDEDDEASRTFSRVLGGCTRQMIILNDIIASVTPAKTSSTLRRTWIGLRSMGKDAKIRETVAILNTYRATMTLHMVSDLSYPPFASSAMDMSSKSEERTFEVPRRRVAYFVGRKYILKKLKDFVLGDIKSSKTGEAIKTPGVLSPSKVAVLVGVGGQGKTQIALELCRQCQNTFGTIIWINASSRDTALSDVKRFVRRLSSDFESSEDAPTILNFFHQWLRNLAKPWMLVFDNYDDPAKFPDIASFYPDHGSIIITSRHQSSKRLGDAFVVNAMTDDEGRDLLLRGQQQEDVEDSQALFTEATAVVERLGNLALAIDQAASYISTRQMSLHQFVEVFELRKKAILGHTPATWEYRAQTQEGQALSAFTTWEMSINQVGSDERQRAFIIDFLTLLAFLDANSVKESLFSTYVEERPRSVQNPCFEIFLSDEKWNSAIYQDLVVELVELALVQHVEYDEGYLLVTLHPIIKEWLQLRITQIKQEMMVQDTIDILAVFLTKNDAVDLPYRLRSALLRHIDYAQLNVSRFLKNNESKETHGGFLQGQQAVFATFYGKHDRTVEAENIFNDVLSRQTDAFGPMGIATLATTNNLAGLYLRSRRFKEAELLLKKVLLGKQQHFPSDDLRITNTVNDLGNVCNQLGRYEEARNHYLKNLEIFLRNKATSLNNLKIVHSNLGEVAMREGKLVEAEEMFEKALRQGRNDEPTCQIVRDGDGQLDEIDCQILMNKGRLLVCTGTFDAAYNTYKKGCWGLAVLLGPKHSRVVAAEEELASMTLSRNHKMSPEELEELQHSQDCDRNPSIRGQCVNWGSAQHQSQLLQFRQGQVNQKASKGKAESSSRLQQGQVPLMQQLQSSLPFLSAGKRTLNAPQLSVPSHQYAQHQQQKAFPFVSDPLRMSMSANERTMDHSPPKQQEFSPSPWPGNFDFNSVEDTEESRQFMLTLQAEQAQTAFPFISEPKRMKYSSNERTMDHSPQKPQEFSSSPWPENFDFNSVKDIEESRQFMSTLQAVDDGSSTEPMDGIQREK